MTMPSRHLSMSTRTAGTILAVAAIGLTAPSSAAASTDAKNPAPNIEGSRITVTSGTSNPIPVASSTRTTGLAELPMVEHNRPTSARVTIITPDQSRRSHLSPGNGMQNSVPDRFLGVLRSWGTGLVHYNNWGDSKQLVIAKFDTESKPRTSTERRRSRWHIDEAGIEVEDHLDGQVVSEGSIHRCNGDSTTGALN